MQLCVSCHISRSHFLSCLDSSIGCIFLDRFRSHWWHSSAEHSGRENRTSSLLIALTVCSILIMLTMGWAREIARAFNGYLIYGQFSLADEQSTYQAEKKRMP